MTASIVSGRVPVGPENTLTRAVAERRARAAPLVDLTVSNPTRVGIQYPAHLLAPLAADSALDYAPEPFGLRSARETVARDMLRRGAVVDARDVVLTASTSEAYSWLFKLLCDPGTTVLAPRPSYPLFDHLTRLEGIRVEPYRLEYQGRWELVTSDVATASHDVRAVIVVSPNNPTGSSVTPDEFATVASLCRDRGWALIVDEVFADYPAEAESLPHDLALGDSGVLTFTLGGLSKTVGLPQLKLGWIVAGGPDRLRGEALAALEIIADTFLSVGTPVQYALPQILESGGGLRQAIQTRVRRTVREVRGIVNQFPACDMPPVEGGWSAVIRLPAIRDEEALVVDLVEHDGILVHPGYFFDFPHEAFVVVSLLIEPPVMRHALPRVLEQATA